eukprot:TRINITY_DN543_c0_g1_i3.p1 TRINITY_DN543_c0_g1~~TRINITY_DN543_c0_g1_i3.p1  ORF type:complete len:159 (+),score=47.43 TRINITY_DN543_c0_g1_i3:67-543(+)
MSDTLIGFVGDDYVLLAADATNAFSIILMKDDEDKIMKLDSHKLLAAGGENGDRVQFCEYIQKNLSLYRYRTGRALGTNAAAHYLRGELARFLRESPYQVNLLMAGHDEEDGPSLYFIDYMASMHKMKMAAHGYGSYFSLSILDRQWRKGMPSTKGSN